jgi:GntR family transcriptional regulator, histidine utilization repressor
MQTLAALALYQKVQRHLLEQIAQGHLKPGTRVPSEHELVKQFSISRMTANRVLSQLATEGVVTRVAGVGTFVAEPRVHSHPLQIRNIADEIRARGHAHECRVLSLATVPATDELAERCAVAIGAKLDHSLLVHLENGSPLQVEDRYVNPKLIRNYLSHDFTQVTPHEVLIRAAPIQRAEHIVRAMLPDSAMRKLLALKRDEACLLIRRRTWSDQRIVSAADLYHPGSRYELTGQFK